MSIAYQCDLCCRYFNGQGNYVWSGEACNAVHGYVQFRVHAQIVNTQKSNPELCNTCILDVLRAAIENKRIAVAVKAEQP